MIDFIARTPGWVAAFAAAHLFWAVLIGACLLSLGYIGLLKLVMALEETRDIRNRNRNR